jgi:hypothetical protein
MKDNWIGHIFPRNCLLKYIIVRKIEETTNTRKERNQLLDELKGNENTLKVKEEARSHCLETSLWKKLWTCLKTML